MINNKKSNQAGHHLGAYILPLLSWFVFQSTSAAAADDSQNEHAITYSGEVARIINENCVVCHREGGIGPMELTSYENVRPWAPLIQLRVANRGRRVANIK